MSETRSCDWCSKPATGGVFGIGIGELASCDEHSVMCNYEVLRRIQQKITRPDLKCPYEVIR